MEEFIRISAVYNGGCVAAEGDAVLDLRPVYEQKTADALEYHAEVTNRSSETIIRKPCTMCISGTVNSVPRFSKTKLFNTSESRHRSAGLFSYMQ